MSNRFEQILNKALEAPHNIPVRDLAGMLVCDDPGFGETLFAAAREVKAKYGKTEVLPRGLIETSNVCAKDCLYCGIRKANEKVARYRLDTAKVLDCVREAVRRGYPAVAFQAGEIESEANTAFYERILRVLPPGLEVTLSLGEQTEEVYRRWKAAAGDRILRYLIRIETSNRDLYARIHPQGYSFERRLSCIRTLKRLGYVTGSGVMIGLPDQTYQDLANDIVFFGEENLDMVGMGPYVPNVDTPLGVKVGVGSSSWRDEYSASPTPTPTPPPTSTPTPTLNSNYPLALRMIALTRLYMHDINIVAATALDALDPAHGRERGIAAGANVVMPVLTPASCRAAYNLYPGKTSAR